MPKHFALALVFCAPFFLATAATIQFDPASYVSPIGMDVTMEVRISQILAGAQLGAFDLIFQFDSSALRFAGFVFGPFLGDPAQVEVINTLQPNGAGTIEATALSLLTMGELQLLQSSSFMLATLVLSPIGHQQSVVNVSGLLSDGTGNPLGVTFQGATVQTIPEPCPGSLLALGLLVIAGARRARMKTSAPLAQNQTNHER